MQLRDNGPGLSPITIALHQLVATLLFSIIGLCIAKPQVSALAVAAQSPRSVREAGGRLPRHETIPLSSPTS